MIPRNRHRVLMFYINGVFFGNSPLFKEEILIIWSWSSNGFVCQTIKLSFSLFMFGLCLLYFLNLFNN
jgi:hypothetical protein